MSRFCVAWSDDFNVLDNAIYKSPVACSLVAVHPSQHTRLPTLPSPLPSYSYSTVPNTKPPKQQRPPRPQGHAQSSQPIPAKASPPSLLLSLRPTAPLVPPFTRSLPSPTRIPLTIGNRSFVPHQAFAHSLSSVGQTATIPAHTVQHCPLDSAISSVFSVRKPTSRTIDPSAMNWMCAVSASLGNGVRPTT
jgi:hypothetical protein